MVFRSRFIEILGTMEFFSELMYVKPEDDRLTKFSDYITDYSITFKEKRSRAQWKNLGETFVQESAEKG